MTNSTDLSDFGEHELDSPDLTLAAKTIFTAKLELLVKTLLLERTSDGSVCLAAYIRRGN
jgi:hypothetical protein